MSDPSSSRPSVGFLVALVLGLLGILSLLMQNVQLRREVGRPLAGSGLEPLGAGPDVSSGVVTGPVQRAVSGPSVDSEGAWRMEAEEASRLLFVEIEKNEKMRKEMLDLRKQIATLSASLTASSVGVTQEDSPRGGSPKVPSMVVSGSSGPGLSGGQIVNVDPALAYATLNIGANAGIREGMRFAVLREDQMIGRVRVIEVRPRVAGAEIEEANEPGLQKGDRVVPWKENNGS